MPESRALAASNVDFSLGPWTDQAKALFLRELVGRRLSHLARERVPIADSSIETLGELAGLLEASDCHSDGDKSLLLRHHSSEITHIGFSNDWADIVTGAEAADRAHDLCERVAAAIRAPNPEENLTSITFWALDSDSDPRPMRRNLKTPSWGEIALNYTRGVRQRMDEILRLRQAPSERMILWHGPPGAGKTHALRALAREWRSWCDMAFITDPEGFFGSSPTYLFEVVKDPCDHNPADAERRSKLIILEDAGELMTVEARRATGQGLSRVLNVTDGLLGQGLKVVVLITTNEPLSVLHPAVVRPGRRLAEIEFSPLTVDEANDWLRRHRARPTVDQPTTLADLYAIAGGRAPARPHRRPVGFTTSPEAA